MADFEVIVVGAGCAGSAAALELARANRSVLIVERGEYAGAKNMTGGRLYTHALTALLGDQARDAPLERRISHERISFITPDASTTLDFTSEKMREARRDSYTVLRAPFDQWLARRAEDAGAEVIYGIPVEGLVYETDEAAPSSQPPSQSSSRPSSQSPSQASSQPSSRRVRGIRAGEDEITAELVVLADGANSLLREELTAAARPAPHTLALGLKQVIELDERTISDRFQCEEGEGAAWLFVGDVTKGHVGGGFLYTNQNSLSLGLIVTIQEAMQAQTSVSQMLEDFREHPAIATLLRGGTLLEYSAHLVPEGGFDAMPPLAKDGVLLAGDAAMLCLNLGYQVRGMDYALASGSCAGRVAVAALEAGDVHSDGLRRYQKALEESFVLKDMRQFRRAPHYLEQTPRLFSAYPALANEALERLFTVDGTPALPLSKSLGPLLREAGPLNLLKDLRRGMRAL
ncbi:MAG: FAD-dependent oxidoreductase [Coriobacteriales bacterium]|jgi:electron transfer flavoprotein-quinone oxidoreductase|nr:FAD-dependent oxidoreductase [Coriobacteriales bacterium]